MLSWTLITPIMLRICGSISELQMLAHCHIIHVGYYFCIYTPANPAGVSSFLEHSWKH